MLDLLEILIEEKRELLMLEMSKLGEKSISIQSMTNTLTTDIKATIKQINQIHNEGAIL